VKSHGMFYQVGPEHDNLVDRSKLLSKGASVDTFPKDDAVTRIIYSSSGIDFVIHEM